MTYAKESSYVNIMLFLCEAFPNHNFLIEYDFELSTIILNKSMIIIWITFNV
jgi:hypothetical protein